MWEATLRKSVYSVFLAQWRLDTLDYAGGRHVTNVTALGPDTSITLDMSPYHINDCRILDDECFFNPQEGKQKW